MGLLPPALWYLGLFLAASNIAARLTQPKAISASLGDAVRLPCTLSTDRITAYTILWFQHQHPNPPKYLLYYKDDSTQRKVAGVSERFSASKDSGSSTCHLTISGVQSEDEGTYFCVTSKGGEWVFGGGTNLLVTGQPTASPSVKLFPPSQEELKTKGKATLPCLISDFYPPTIQVNWQADGKPISSGVETTPATKQGDKYVASSYLTLSQSEWESHDRYTCKVTHEGENFDGVVNRADSA